MLNKLRRNKKKGFSLVELIVVIAVMAVLLAVLAPSLLQYVERSRAQKDDSAMSEVTNAIKLAMADQDVYDEMLAHNESANKSTYSDRISDETPWGTEGEMRGTTITFTPENKVMTLANGEINKYALAQGATAAKIGNLGGEGKGILYNKARVAVGDTIELTSQTYKNSPYTVFVEMGTLGGNDHTKMNAINVYGQWGGTNLLEGGLGNGEEQQAQMITFTVGSDRKQYSVAEGTTWGQFIDSLGGSIEVVSSQYGTYTFSYEIEGNDLCAWSGMYWLIGDNTGETTSTKRDKVIGDGRHYYIFN